MKYAVLVGKTGQKPKARVFDTKNQAEVYLRLASGLRIFGHALENVVFEIVPVVNGKIRVKDGKIA